MIQSNTANMIHSNTGQKHSIHDRQHCRTKAQPTWYKTIQEQNTTYILDSTVGTKWYMIHSSTGTKYNLHDKQHCRTKPQPTYRTEAQLTWYKALQDKNTHYMIHSTAGLKTQPTWYTALQDKNTAYMIHSNTGTKTQPMWRTKHILHDT